MNLTSSPVGSISSVIARGSRRDESARDRRRRRRNRTSRPPYAIRSDERTAIAWPIGIGLSLRKPAHRASATSVISHGRRSPAAAVLDHDLVAPHRRLDLGRVPDAPAADLEEPRRGLRSRCVRARQAQRGTTREPEYVLVACRDRALDDSGVERRPRSRHRDDVEAAPHRVLQQRVAPADFRMIEDEVAHRRTTDQQPQIADPSCRTVRRDDEPRSHDPSLSTG
jgi:hypothetical protein